VRRRVPVYKSVADVWRHRPARWLRGSVTVKQVAEVQVGRRRFWRTSDGELIDARAIRPLEPSGFQGVDLSQEGAPSLPLAWVRRVRSMPQVPVRALPSSRAEQVATLAARTVVSVLEHSADGAYARVAEGWVSMRHLHLAAATAPPPEALEGERWFDVDLLQQVLVAYEGMRPVYATLISSGRRAHSTPEGVFRIWIKFSETNMSGRMAQSSYRVAHVPWTQFFLGDFALHTAYWHDRFGQPASHGCINLAPRDARLLYGWSAPQVPTGWSMAYDSPQQRGSLVRVRRHAAEPMPLLQAAARAPEGPQVCTSDASAPKPLEGATEGALARN
jgi:hypothetical protein